MLLIPTHLCEAYLHITHGEETYTSQDGLTQVYTLPNGRSYRLDAYHTHNLCILFRITCLK